jgi:hypothetical protein
MTPVQKFFGPDILVKTGLVPAPGAVKLPVAGELSIADKLAGRGQAAGYRVAAARDGQGAGRRSQVTAGRALRW